MTHELEDHHRIALARELTYAAGCPPRDRWGWASSDADVLAIVRFVAAHPGAEAVAAAIGTANALGDIEIGQDREPADDQYERRIVTALRPLIADRRRAADRGLDRFTTPRAREVDPADPSE